MSAGGANAINMWYDRDIDALMVRTRNRPIPAGRVVPQKALTFGFAISVIAVIVMGVAVNWVAAALLAFANAFYVFVYTIWLKRRTPQNIVIGGAAGAFPPAIGWLSVTGSLDTLPLLMFLIIFMWTPPHFWALAVYKFEEYKKSSNQIFYNVNIHDKDSILTVINKAKVELNDIWKDFNEINTSIKLSINLILNSNNADKISKFENTLTKIDDINSFSIKKFDLNKTVYEIIYNTNPNKLIKKFSAYGFEIVNTEGLWVIQ